MCKELAILATLATLPPPGGERRHRRNSGDTQEHPQTSPYADRRTPYLSSHAIVARALTGSEPARSRIAARLPTDSGRSAALRSVAIAAVSANRRSGMTLVRGNAARTATSGMPATARRRSESVHHRVG